ncbi:hypothetical protein J6590_064554, partial [Homalodisca vitripennis]
MACGLCTEQGRKLSDLSVVVRASRLGPEPKDLFTVSHECHRCSLQGTHHLPS